VDSTIVENFGQEMEQARAELPALKGPQLIMLGHVGQSLPSQPVLAELGCCACFNRPPRQAYLRNALAVALAGIPTTLALPHCTLNTGNSKTCTLVHFLILVCFSVNPTKEIIPSNFVDCRFAHQVSQNKTEFFRFCKQIL